MRKLTVALALVLAPLILPASIAAKPSAAAQTLVIDKQRIDAALAQMIASDRAGGVSALVWQDGREVYYGSAGFADRAANRPMARDTIAQIYSMTKPVTGVALMQLWEAGKFRLDDPLAKYLPEYANMRVYAGKDDAGQPRYVPADRPITIRDILRHTAGFAYGAGPTAGA
ncbi:serine hydrolase [Sphingopyxis sp. PET50]|uniref:serine hydrolase domain-containing protein n=1 Tax=Sphingopyxis sp. PET50 TaxID=2976533 RepID=UPI0021B087BA|nr:serine hydrolase domain-containing protein [Sphingopyxis sp. PET50]